LQGLSASSERFLMADAEINARLRKRRRVKAKERRQPDDADNDPKE
jgi:hypothetical protein